MSFISTKSKFHVALDSVGLLLQGAPDRPSYQSSHAPVYGTRFASGDRDYNDLSQWWYLVQTDWSGGFKDSLSFEDDAKYYYSTNIDAYSQPGALKLERALTTERDNTANSDACLDVGVYTYNGSDTVLYLDGSNARKLSSGSVEGSTLSGDVMQQFSRANYLWQIFSGGGVATWDGTTQSDKKSQIDSVIDGSIDTSSGCGGCAYGNTTYIFGLSTTDKFFCVKTTVANPASSADWTLVFEISMGNALEVCGISVLGAEIIILLENCPSLATFSLISFDIASGTPTVLQEFSGDQTGIYRYGARYVRTFGSVALITIPTDNNNGKGDIYSYDGATLEKIYSTDSKKYAIGNQAVGFIKGGCVVAGQKAYWGNLVYDGESFYNFIKTVDDDATYVAVPIGYDPGANELYLADTETVSGDTQVIIYAYDLDDPASYKTGASNSAFAVFSQHDKLQSIDKLLNSITIGFENFASGQSISIYYTTEPTPSTDVSEWTLLGTASYTDDGDSVVTRTFPFPVGTIGKKIWIRTDLASTTSGTPVLTDLTLEYLPLPDYKKQWVLNVNCADEVKRMDGRLVETTARELKARLEKAWWTKSALDFQDLDFAQTTLSDNPLSSSATTVNVSSTDNFPEQGRIKIDDEEIFYTGKNKTSFTGCTRGARGTRASSHTQSSVVHNGYRVIVIGCESRVPVILEDKNLEYVVGLTLREV